MVDAKGKVWAVCDCCGDRMAVRRAAHMEALFIGKRCQSGWCPTCEGPCRGTYRIPKPS
jgi:hypothetical protein